MMKKLKMALVTAAVVLAVSGAFATKPKVLCEGQTQYYFNGTNYLAAGQFGLDYDCDNLSSSTCTYYRPDPVGHPNTYVACRVGVFMNLDLNRH